MKFNKWTLALAATGVVSLASAVQAEEAKQSVMTALSSTTLSGYVDTSAIWKFGTGNGLVGRSYDGTAKQDGFNLNAVKLTLEKPVDEGNWSAGYKTDLIFGPDAAAFRGTGLVSDGSSLSIKQAYVALRAPVGNGLDIKMGVFDTVVGYEVFDSGNNPNYSRSYGYFLEPLSHTGVLLSYQAADWISLSAGVANTYNDGIINARAARASAVATAESEKTYMASVALTAPESFGSMKGATLAAGIVDGLAGGKTDTTILYAGLTLPTPIDALKLGLAYDHRFTSTHGKTSFGPGNAFIGGNDSTYAWAAAAYASIKATEKLTINTRAEYATGTDGTFYLVSPAGDFSPKGNDDTRNELFGVTVTADYALWANVITRVEARYDIALVGGDNATSKPFGGGNPDKTALSLALNVIYKF